jgi:hypothetical protein
VLQESLGAYDPVFFSSLVFEKEKGGCWVAEKTCQYQEWRT